MIRLPKFFLSLAILAILAAPALADHKTTYGKIKSVAADQNNLVLTDKDNKDWTFDLTDNARIFMNNDWNTKLKELKAGQAVALVWDKKGDKYMTDAVLVREGDFRDVGIDHVTVKSVAADKNQFRATGPEGKEWTYDMTDAAKIRLADKDIKLNELKEGDTLFVVYDKKGDKYMVRAIHCNRK